FKHLEGWWCFKEKAKQGTDVSFKLQFEFTNKLVQMAFGQMFQMITEKMMQAFVKRAKEVYGPR
ncbi:MAG TPA: SRPBCC family protein, partial [Gammaproteobacteria bacterium]|nr:SRPBCC family protein [Gammaproteobacteria bacterium]